MLAVAGKEIPIVADASLNQLEDVADVRAPRQSDGNSVDPRDVTDRITRTPGTALIRLSSGSGNFHHHAVPAGSSPCSGKDHNPWKGSHRENNDTGMSA